MLTEELKVAKQVARRTSNLTQSSQASSTPSTSAASKHANSITIESDDDVFNLTDEVIISQVKTENENSFTQQDDLDKSNQKDPNNNSQIM